jgi:hypothetical protein
LGILGCELRVRGCGMRVTGYGLRVAGCGLRVAGCGLGVAGCGLRVTGCGFRVAGKDRFYTQPRYRSGEFYIKKMAKRPKEKKRLKRGSPLFSFSL